MSATEVQALLRFLTQDAKVPLAAALPKVGELRKMKLNNAESIAKTSLTDISSIFADGKLAKQVLSAAKRVSNPKKRGNPSSNAPFSTSKRVKLNGDSPDLETDLELPLSQISEDDLANVVIRTNRAPLVLAFAVMLLKYTMPEQPLSSRLSLSQALVSANSQTKAKSIGLTNENTAEDEGWGQGQPQVRIMGRQIAVMRRAPIHVAGSPDTDSQATVDENPSRNTYSAFWGLDLEALRKSNGPLVAGKNLPGHAGLPVHSPQAAKNYMLRSFTLLDEPEEQKSGNMETKTEKNAKPRTPNASEVTARKEQAAAILFKALDLLFASWKSTLSAEDLDRRAWSWYLHVRPEVAQGQSGWGQKGELKLSEILKLRRNA